MENSKEKYNTAWFKERAFNSLKKISDGVWDYSDSLLLYVSSGADVYESIQEVDTPYFKLVTKSEREYLQAIAKNIVDMLPDNFEYIDLGPGTEHKEQFFFDEIKKQRKNCKYIPVDISERFLDLAESYAVDRKIDVKRVKASFEELPELLGEPTIARFVSLGLTFSNYNPQEIIDLLKNIAGQNGFIFINAQMRDRTDMDALQKVYQDNAVHLVDDKLILLGLDPIVDVTPRVVDDGFRMSCSILKGNKNLQEVGIKKDDRLIVFQSLRYTKYWLEKELKDLNFILFDTGSSFIASIIKT